MATPTGLCLAWCFCIYLVEALFKRQFASDKFFFTELEIVLYSHELASEVKAKKVTEKQKKLVCHGLSRHRREPLVQTLQRWVNDRQMPWLLPLCPELFA